MNENTGQLLAIRELCKKIVSTKVAGMPLVISGSAPLDLILQRVPKDLDVYYLSDSEDRMHPDAITYMLSMWGVGGGLNNAPLSVQVLDNEYGTHTLKYDVTGQYKGFPVQIQFISVNSQRYRDSINRYSTISNNMYVFHNILTDSFPVNTSKNTLFLTEFNTLAVAAKTPIKISPDNEIHLGNIVYTGEASPKLVAKCIDKYMKYCDRPFKKVASISGMFSRTFILPEGSTKCVLLNVPLLCNEVPLHAAKTFDSLPDSVASAKASKEYMSRMWAAIDAATVGAGSRPQNWPSQGSAAQELQSVRE